MELSSTKCAKKRYCSTERQRQTPVCVRESYRRREIPEPTTSQWTQSEERGVGVYLERVAFPDDVELLVAGMRGAQGVDDGHHPLREVVAYIFVFVVVVVVLHHARVSCCLVGDGGGGETSAYPGPRA